MPVRISQDGNTTENKYLYQGKEFNQTENLNTYDFHARQYDPLLGRFTAVDPMNQFASGYVGMANNPTSYVDPTGMYALTDAWLEMGYNLVREQQARNKANAASPAGVSMNEFEDMERNLFNNMLHGAVYAERFLQASAEFEDIVRGRNAKELRSGMEKKILEAKDRRGIKLDKLTEMQPAELAAMFDLWVGDGTNGAAVSDQPSAEKGGIFSNEEAAADYIYNKAFKEGVEIGYMEINSGEASYYYVLPWKPKEGIKNTFASTNFNFDFLKKLEVTKVVHTHNSNPEKSGHYQVPGPSNDDYTRARKSRGIIEVVLDYNKTFWVSNARYSEKASQGRTIISYVVPRKRNENGLVLFDMKTVIVPSNLYRNVSWNQYFNKP